MSQFKINGYYNYYDQNETAFLNNTINIDNIEISEIVKATIISEASLHDFNFPNTNGSNTYPTSKSFNSKLRVCY